MRIDAGLTGGGETLHPDTVLLVDGFANALKAKLLKSQVKYGYGNSWLCDDWMDKCRNDLKLHMDKGDPLDVAAYCAFLWHHKEPTVVKESVDTEIFE